MTLRFQTYSWTNIPVDAFDKYLKSFTSNLGKSKTRLDQEEEEDSCWIDILFNDQRTPEGIQKSLRIAEVIYKLARFHAVFYSASVFDRAWCLLELTIRRRAGKESLLCSYLDTSESKPREYVEAHDFFGTMDCWDKTNDLPAIKAKVVSIFGSSKAFNRAMHELCAHLRMTYPDGTRYEGKLMFGQRNGLGRLHLRDAVKYEGFFKSDVYHGRGKLQVYDVVLEGTWREGELESDGVVRFSDGRSCRRRHVSPEVFRVLSSYERLSLDTGAGVECMLATQRNRVVTGGFDRTLRLWDLGSGECVRLMAGHTHSVRCLALTEKSRVASGSGDKTIKLWDLGTGACIKTLSGHTFTILTLLAIDKTRLISGSADKCIKVWDTASEACTRTLTGHADYVCCLAAYEKDKIISGSGDKTVKIWDLTSGACLSTLSCGGQVSAICLLAGNTSLVVGSGSVNVDRSLDDSRPRTAAALQRNEVLELWDLSSDKLTKSVRVLSGSASAPAQINDLKILAGNMEGSLTLWDLQSGLALKNVKCHNDRVSSLVVVGDTFITGSYDGRLKVWR